MNDYMEVSFTPNPCNNDITDVLAALLADVGYESFVPDPAGLTAYVRADRYSPEAVNECLQALPFTTEVKWEATNVEGRDWNHEWEKNYFKPIVVADRCVIHSSFHTDIPSCEFDIVIDPKMAFGTGHHSTTSLIIRRLLDLPLRGETLIDMGTGTGILAILAAMRGAARIIGIEIDRGAYENALENVALNHHPEIELICGDARALDSVDVEADYMLANINRNVILADLGAYTSRIRPGGLLILSGFYLADVNMLVEAAKLHGLQLVDVTDLNDWASICLKRID